MRSEDEFVVIRIYQAGDENVCCKLLKEGVMATVKPAFLTALTREITFQVIITTAALMFVFIGLPPTICISSIPATVIFIYFWIYMTHLNSATNLAKEAFNIERDFLSSKYSC